MSRVHTWMSHVTRTHMNESCYAYTHEWVMSRVHTWMSHVTRTHMNESCHAYTHEWVMSHIHTWMSHVTHTHIIMSCHAYTREWVMSRVHTWLSHVTHTHVSALWYVGYEAFILVIHVCHVATLTRQLHMYVYWMQVKNVYEHNTTMYKHNTTVYKAHSWTTMYKLLCSYTFLCFIHKSCLTSISNAPWPTNKETIPMTHEQGNHSHDPRTRKPFPWPTNKETIPMCMNTTQLCIKHIQLCISTQLCKHFIHSCVVQHKSCLTSIPNAPWSTNKETIPMTHVKHK